MLFFFYVNVIGYLCENPPMSSLQLQTEFNSMSLWLVMAYESWSTTLTLDHSINGLCCHSPHNFARVILLACPSQSSL